MCKWFENSNLTCASNTKENGLNGLTYYILVPFILLYFYSNSLLSDYFIFIGFSPKKSFEMIRKRKAYCIVPTCINFDGTFDKSEYMFRYI